MRYFSLFSGIGGFELGIQNAFRKHQKGGEGVKDDRNDADGAESEAVPICVGYSDIDRYAIETYESHFDHRNYGDVTKIDPPELPDFDLLVGGFPCQAFSVAGKREGFNDTRGTLFFDIARILEDKRPRHFILENVRGLLSHDKGKTFQTIIGVLADLGYGVEWQVLNSRDFGVPQNRERVFIVGHLRGECGRKIFPLGEGFRQSSEVQVPELRGSGPRPIWVVSDTQESRRVIQGRYKIRRLTPVEYERLQGFPDSWTLGSDTQRYKQCGNAVTVNVVEAVVSALKSHL